MEEYSHVKNMFNKSDRCVREAIYEPFRIINPLGMYISVL